MFSIDTENGFPDLVLINAAYGLGENVVQGAVNPDEFRVFKPTLLSGSRPIIGRRIGSKEFKLVYDSSELGVPAIVGAGNATEVLRDGAVVTVSCAQGETGYVYEGAIPFDIERLDLGQLERPRTKVMLSVGNPESALALSFLPNDGVGLARLEFIIGTTIRVHPMALVHYESW